MCTSYVAAVAAIALGLSVVPALAQSEEDSSAVISASHNVKPLGYTDPQTGVFHPVLRVAPETTTGPLTGTIQLTISVSLKSTFAKGSTLMCSAMVAATTINIANPTGTGTDWIEDAYTTQAVSGSAATCVVTIPYSWAMPASSSTVMNELDGEYTVAVMAPATTTTTLSGVTPLRSSTSTFVN